MLDLWEWHPLFLWIPTEAKLKELLSSLSSLTLTEAETGTLMALLQQKSPSAMEAWHKVRYYCDVIVSC